MKTTLLALSSALFLFACGSSTPAPTETSAAPASPTTETKSDVKPADSAAAPASSPCKEVPATTAKDKTACIAECQKLDDTAPAGSRCIPPRAACSNRCNQMK